MNLYLIQQNVVTAYDAYDSAVVQAESVEEASKIYPGDSEGYQYSLDIGDWTRDNTKVLVTYLGKATPSLNLSKVICASFHEG